MLHVPVALSWSLTADLRYYFWPSPFRDFLELVLWQLFRLPTSTIPTSQITLSGPYSPVSRAPLSCLAAPLLATHASRPPLSNSPTSPHSQSFDHTTCLHGQEAILPHLRHPPFSVSLLPSPRRHYALIFNSTPSSWAAHPSTGPGDMQNAGPPLLPTPYCKLGFLGHIHFINP